MVCGSARRDIVIKFSDKVLDVVDQYKYLSNLMNSVKRGNQDVFGANYQYLCNKASIDIGGLTSKYIPDWINVQIQLNNIFPR